MVYITVLSPYIALDSKTSIKPILQVLNYTENWIKKTIPFKVHKYYYTSFSVRDLKDCIRLIQGFPNSELLYDREFKRGYETFTINTGSYFTGEKEGIYMRYSFMIVKFIFRLGIEKTQIVAEITSDSSY